MLLKEDVKMQSKIKHAR